MTVCAFWMTVWCQLSFQVYGIFISFISRTVAVHWFYYWDLLVMLFQMKTSSWIMMELVCCPWQMLVPILMVLSSLLPSRLHTILMGWSLLLSQLYFYVHFYSKINFRWRILWLFLCIIYMRISLSISWLVCSGRYQNFKYFCKYIYCLFDQ